MEEQKNQVIISGRITQDPFFKEGKSEKSSKRYTILNINIENSTFNKMYISAKTFSRTIYNTWKDDLKKNDIVTITGILKSEVHYRSKELEKPIWSLYIEIQQIEKEDIFSKIKEKEEDPAEILRKVTKEKIDKVSADDLPF